jgi:hypothetical protein
MYIPNTIQNIDVREFVDKYNNLFNNQELIDLEERTTSRATKFGISYKPPIDGYLSVLIKLNTSLSN